MKAELSIVIPHHNDEENLDRLLKSISLQKTNFVFEVLVISNPGSVKAKDLVERYSHFQNFDLNQVGVNRARNEGLRKANSNILIFFDSDCDLDDQNLLQKHFDRHLENPQMVCLGGVYTHSSESILDQAYNFIQRRWLYWGAEQDSCSYLLGGHFSCKKLLLKGFEFDESIVYGGSETEFFCRLKIAEIPCRLDLSLGVAHNTQLTMSDFVLKLFKQGAGAAYIERKLSFQFKDFYSNYGAVEFHDRNFFPEMRFGIFLAEQAFLKGKSSEGAGFPSWKRRLFILKAWLKYKKMRTLEFLRSVEELSK